MSRLDHDANVRPWVQAAESAGATVLWADVDCGELPAEQYDDLLTARTRLVAVTAASNAPGTMPDIGPSPTGRTRWAPSLRRRCARHAAQPVDVAAPGADFYASRPKVARPAPRHDRRGPGSSRPSTRTSSCHLRRAGPVRNPHPPFAELAGVTAAVDWLASQGQRRTAAPAAGRRGGDGAHEASVFVRLLDGLRADPRVTLVGDPAVRTPTVAFTVAGNTPQQTAARLARAGRGLAATTTPRSSCGALGLETTGGAVRAGVVCYTTDDEVNRLLPAL